MTIIAKHFKFNAVTDVPQPTGTYPLCPYNGSVYIYGGIYNLDGYNVDMRETGLYRFKTPSRNNYLQLIVWKAQDGSTDLESTLSAISWNTVYGSYDELAPSPDAMTGHQLQTVSNAGSIRKWRHRCGYADRYLRWILPQIGKTCRTVQLRTAETFNNWDDGHVTTEVLNNGKWEYWDVSNGLYFTDATGAIMSAYELSKAYRDGTTATPVRFDATNKFSSDAPNNFDVSVNRDANMLTDEQVDAWYRRIFQLQEMGTTTWLPPGTEHMQSYFQSRGITILTEAQFLAQHYP